MKNWKVIWSFQCKGHSRWLEAECSRCHVKTRMSGVGGFLHCGQRELPPQNVLKEWAKWTPPEIPEGEQAIHCLSNPE